jgi:predicted metal-dependent HD superfamily phosphohydrolase
MELDKLLADIEAHITAEFNAHPDPRLLYHDIVHTREVVSAVTTISGYYSLSAYDRFPILAAAWFHDLAWAISGVQDHERRSADLARTFLADKGVAEAMIREVEGCIMATKVPQQAQTLKEKIMADADLYHLGKSNFQEKSDLLREETALLTGEPLSGTVWRANVLHFLESHQYFTEFAKQELQKHKDETYQLLKEKQERKLAKKQKEAVLASSPEAPFDLSVTEKIKDKDKPSRGIETLFRLTSRNQMDLNGLADNKAGIMISVNSIIISVILTVLLRKLEDQPHLVIPTLIMLTVNILTIIFSILATRPKIIANNFTDEDISSRKINMLFFGHFQKLSFEQYSSGIKQMLKERDYLYSSLIKDIYYQGLVLNKKYKYLSISYTIFMYGLIISVAAFGIAVYANSF